MSTDLLRVTDDEIRKVCGYISSDEWIAQWYGTPLERVKKCRNTMPKGKVRKKGAMSGIPAEDSPNYGKPADWEKNAREGSRALLEKLEEYMCKDARYAGSAGHLMAVAALNAPA